MNKEGKIFQKGASLQCVWYYKCNTRMQPWFWIDFQPIVILANKQIRSCVQASTHHREDYLMIVNVEQHDSGTEGNEKGPLPETIRHRIYASLSSAKETSSFKIWRFLHFQGSKCNGAGFILQFGNVIGTEVIAFLSAINIIKGNFFYAFESRMSMLYIW